MPVYVGMEGFSNPNWLIIAACSDGLTIEESEEIEIAIVPMDAVTDELLEEAQKGRHRNEVSCLWEW